MPALPPGFIQLTSFDTTQPLFMNAYEISLVRANMNPVSTLVSLRRMDYSVVETPDAVLGAMAAAMTSATVTLPT